MSAPLLWLGCFAEPYTADVDIGVSGDHATTDWPKGVTRKMHIQRLGPPNRILPRYGLKVRARLIPWPEMFPITDFCFLHSFFKFRIEVAKYDNRS